MIHPVAPDFGLPENIYGHVKRLDWIVSHLKPGDRVLEIGCGTGYMITIPLIRAGWDAIGVDTDAASIEYGRRLLVEEGQDPERIKSVDASALPGRFDAIVLSEVLEHIPSDGIASLLETTRGLLVPGGRLLVTVPNGYGWFEFETFLWNRLHLGRLVEVLRVSRLVHAIKSRLAPLPFSYEHPSSLDSSPHVQRFTLGSITRVIEEAGYEVTDRSGTVLFAGQFSNLLFTGFAWPTRVDVSLGSSMPSLASSFMIAARRDGLGERGEQDERPLELR